VVASRRDVWTFALTLDAIVKIPTRRTAHNKHLRFNAVASNAIFISTRTVRRVSAQTLVLSGCLDKFLTDQNVPV